MYVGSLCYKNSSTEPVSEVCGHIYSKSVVEDISSVKYRCVDVCSLDMVNKNGENAGFTKSRWTWVSIAVTLSVHLKCLLEEFQFE